MDDADVMLAGGAEGAICPIGIAGFGQARALSTGFRDEPWRGSRPYDRDRDGFVMTASDIFSAERSKPTRSRRTPTLIRLRKADAGQRSIS